MMRVSFLIAAYNEEKYIIECVESCLRQTHLQVEVCVTDDGSTDRTWSLLNAHYHRDPRVRLTRFENNRGKVAAFNQSYRQATGHYFALIGADDVAVNDRIEVSYAFLKKAGLDLVYAKMLICNETLTPLPVGQVIVKNHRATLARLLTDNFCYGSTLFFNRKIAEKCFPIPTDLLFEDWWIGFIALLYGNVQFLDKFVTFCRQHEKNTISNPDDTKLVETLKKDFVRHYQYYRWFYKKIWQSSRIQNKEKYFKIIRLNYAYRIMFYCQRLNQRLKFLPVILNNIVPSPIFIYAIGLTIMGTRLYGFKQTNLYKRLYKNIHSMTNEF